MFFKKTICINKLESQIQEGTNEEQVQVKGLCLWKGNDIREQEVRKMCLRAIGINEVIFDWGTSCCIISFAKLSQT